MTPDDKKGRVEHPNWLFRGFQDAIQDCNINDLPLMGYPFTWERSKGKENVVEERLDRVMVSPVWLEKFPTACLSNLSAPISDHSPILLNTSGNLVHRVPKRFRFENRWFCDPGLRETVMDSWRESVGLDIQNRLTHCSELLISWGRKFSNTFKEDIGRVKRRLDAFRRRDDEESVEQEKALKNQLTSLLVQQEIYWQQRAKNFWLRDGDSNTRFFHASASARRKANRIQRLKNDNGIWVEDVTEICSTVGRYFENLFSASRGNYDPVFSAIEPRITRDDNESLIRPFHIDEFKLAVSQMHPDKSPGPDGFNPAFYQKIWHVIGEDVFKA
ncbi:uncharacterized protein [Henckelia pumila]|uniref:uncharacterized protein n=1 Tax=Henckelia pumila TaxID=405737 RepID=UPI003C6DE0F5